MSIWIKGWGCKVIVSNKRNVSGSIMDRIQVSVNHWRSCREGTAGTSGSLGFRGDGQYHRMEGRSLSEMTNLNGSNFGQLANFSKEREAVGTTRPLANGYQRACTGRGSKEVYGLFLEEINTSWIWEEMPCTWTPRHLNPDSLLPLGAFMQRTAACHGGASHRVRKEGQRGLARGYKIGHATFHDKYKVLSFWHWWNSAFIKLSTCFHRMRNNLGVRRLEFSAPGISIHPWRRRLPIFNACPSSRLFSTTSCFLPPPFWEIHSRRSPMTPSWHSCCNRCLRS